MQRSHTSTGKEISKRFRSRFSSRAKRLSSSRFREPSLPLVLRSISPDSFRGRMSSDELRAKGVDLIACVAVNDAFVLKAWEDSIGIGDSKVLLLSDGNGQFTKAMGVSVDLSDKPVGLGVRSRQYSLLADNGVVKVLNLEEGGSFTVSGADDMLKAL